MDEGQASLICENIAANNILSAYTKKAEKEGIKVSLDVHVDKECTILDVYLSPYYEHTMTRSIFNKAAIRSGGTGICGSGKQHKPQVCRKGSGTYKRPEILPSQRHACDICVTGIGGQNYGTGNV